jgi:hypothetical protein
MANDEETFELKLVEPQILEERYDERSMPSPANLQVSPALPMAVFSALKSAAGADALIEQMPAFNKPIPMVDRRVFQRTQDDRICVTD